MRKFDCFNNYCNSKYQVRLINREEKAGYFTVFDLLNQIPITSKWFEIKYNEVMDVEYIELPFYDFSKVFSS